MFRLPTVSVRHQRQIGAAFLILGAAAMTAACGGDDKENANTANDYQQGQQGYQPYGAQTAQPQPTTQPSAQQGQVNPVGQILSDPNALQQIISGALAGTQASLGAMAGGQLKPIEEGIKQQAQTTAKGARPEGELMSANLQQGGHAEAQFIMQPNRCYSIVGFGGLGVFEFQINLMTAPPAPPQVIAQSAPGGNAPTLGPNEQCIRNPTPVPMPVKVDMHLLKGQGLVGAQVYAK